MLISTFVSRYIREREVSPQYAEMVAKTVELFSKWLSHPATLDDLTDDRVSRYLIDRSDGVSRWTVRGERVKLLSLWRAAWQADLVPLPPRRVRKIVIPKAAPRAWSLGDMRKLLATAERVQGMFTRNKYPMRKAAFWRAVVLVGYSTGLRLGDLERLRFDDVEADGTLWVTQNKTGQLIRCCLLPEAHEAVKAIRWPARTFIFRDVICRRYYFDAFKEIVRAAGLNGTTKWLRRTSGTMVESIAPGRGHEQLGNGRKVFEVHYLDQRHLAATRPMPPGLVE